MLFPLNEELLANKLEIDLKTLGFFVTCLRQKDKELPKLYTKKTIRAGRKVRIAWSANSALRRVQGNIKEMLERAMVRAPESYAYELGICAKDAAQQLSGWKYIYAWDIKNHFGSIKLDTIKEVLERAGAGTKVSYYIARLCCVNYKHMDILAQGTCTAPIVANRVSEAVLDPVVKAYLEEGDKYLRYSDNLFIATNRVKPRGFIQKVSDDVLHHTGWICHKTKFMPYYRQQKVLGMTVNQRPNIPKKVWDNLKAEFHCAYLEGKVGEKRYLVLQGKAAYWEGMLSPMRRRYLNTVLQALGGVNA